jgi:hypothetical protein
MVEDDVCCAAGERSVCKKGIVLDVYEQIVCTFSVKYVFDFTLLSAHVEG